MGHFSYERLARGVARDKLFQWYTDFSSEDAEIISRRGDGSLLSRKVSREGNNMHIESEMLVMGKPRKMIADAVVHPDNYTYDIRSTMQGMLEANRHYTFEEIPGQGTKIRFNDSYRTLSGTLKILDALGVLKRAYVKGSAMTLKAYVAEAEEQLAEKR